MVMYVLLRLIGVILLVAANAFFVAAEYSLVSIRDTRIEQLIAAHRIGARTVQRLHQKLDEVLNGVQLGVTMASLALGWVGEDAFARLLERGFGSLPYAPLWAHAIAIMVAFGLITYMHVILGEVVPKSLALHKAERVALAVAAPLDVFMAIFGPFLRFMAASTRYVLRIFGVREIRQGGAHSAEELKLVVTASGRMGVIPRLQEEMILHALDLETITVREIMVPRPDIFSLPGNMTLDEAYQRVVDEQHSRVPVYDPERGPEHIIGVLYAKDLMRWMQRQMAEPDPTVRQITALRVRHIMREVLVVPETKTLPDVLVEFKNRKRHLAVVVDEFGSTAGVVTVEDVLEQLVGEIEDEYDTAPEVLRSGAAAMVLDGATNIRDLESQYQLRLPRDEGFETLAGFVLSRLQRIPQPGDKFEYEGRRYTVLDMQGRRIGNVKIEQVEKQPLAISH
jgi:CBS domain containing-hemolysin-like protein